MTYSSVGFVALLIMLIVNNDVFRKKESSEKIPAYYHYRRLLFGLSFYYAADIMWGIFNEFRLSKLLYVATVVYFIAMALSILLWTYYVINYLDEKTKFSNALHFVGQAFFILVFIALMYNFYQPKMFWFDKDGTYCTGTLRHISFVIQIALFFFTSVYALLLSRRTRKKKRPRYRALGVFGLVMIAMICLQVKYQLMPLYALGCMFGTCILHTFVHEDEKYDYYRRQEELLRKEQEHKKALGSARELAYTDPLTGVKSKLAYIEAAELIDMRISEGSLKEFGIIVFDLDGLKKINDTKGHEQGDKYIKDGCKMICRVFSHSPVYRIGGDEFAVLLEGRDFENRNALLSVFDREVEENLLSGSVVVSSGADVFDPEHDNSFSAVFERADKKMLERKQSFKETRTI